MNIIYLIVTLASLVTRNVNGLRITGPYSNITEVLNRITAKVNGWIPNYLPDLTHNDNTKQRVMDLELYRRSYYLEKYINALTKAVPSDKSEEFVSDDFTDYYEDSKLKEMEIDGKQSLRNSKLKSKDIEKKKERERRKEVAQIREEHKNRMKEIIEFMEPNYQTTMFLLSEVRRIKRDKIVIDELREMIRYVEDPKRESVKRDLLKCFEKLKRAWQTKVDIWQGKPNNLVINTIKDPFNYGFIN